MRHTIDHLSAWFEAHSDITQILVGLFDYNGVLRGKRVPASKYKSLLTSGLKMPRSIQVLDILGHDIEDSPLVFASGDADATAHVTGRLPIRLPYLSEPTALLLVAFDDEEISPKPYVKATDDDAIRLLCGVEMEFMLLHPDAAAPAPSLQTGQSPQAGNILSALHLDDYDGLLADIRTFCDEQDIAIDTITSEAGMGQFEVTFQPKQDLAVLAEDILVFKSFVKGLAKSHGIKASFMAKPLEGQAGNGMHVHASIIDAQTGANLFDEETGGTAAEQRLSHSVGGLLSLMQEASLIFAPLPNSYRRLVPSAHAPVQICWGYDNRTAAIRIPDSSPAARRLEVRSAGADANPYFLLALLRHAILSGLAQEIAPPAAISGNAYEQSHPKLAQEMGQALALWEASSSVEVLFGATLKTLFADTKRQEFQIFTNHIPPLEFEILSEQL